MIPRSAKGGLPFFLVLACVLLAGCFHGFYHDCPILADDVDPALAQARLWLVEAARIGLVIGLGLLGVSAPEAM